MLFSWFYGGSMNKIPLMKGGVPVDFAIVDAAAFDELSRYRWHLLITGSGMRYAYRAERVAGNKKWSLFMHRQIMGLVRGDGKIVDHINRNSLDNRRENLRLCTVSENNKNRSLRVHSRCKRGHPFEDARQIGGRMRRKCRICNRMMSARLAETKQR